MICSFVPRLFDYHPLSIPAPYNHSNIDSDEVLYYAEGEFMSINVQDGTKLIGSANVCFNTNVSMKYVSQPFGKPL